jgi:hypothetical protein
MQSKFKFNEIAKEHIRKVETIKEKDKTHEATVRFKRSVIEITSSRNSQVTSEALLARHRKSASMMSSENIFNSFNKSQVASRKSLFTGTSQPPTRLHPKDSLFFIPQEDRIFEDDKLKSCIEFINKMNSDKSKKDKNQEKTIQKLYKISPDNLKKLKVAKKMKNLDLEKYQRHLLQTASEMLSNESIRKLETRLTKVRKKANQIRHIEHMEPLFDEIKEQDNISIMKLRNSYSRVMEFKCKKEDLPIINN